jgi:hypothetical protein
MQVMLMIDLAFHKKKEKVMIESIFKDSSMFQQPTFEQHFSWQSFGKFSQDQKS